MKEMNLRQFEKILEKSDQINHIGPVAQLVEQLTVNQLVAGSSPAGPANLVADNIRIS